MADKSKIKLIMKSIAIAAVITMVISMTLMFTGLLSQFIAMPIAIATPAIATIAAFVEKWDWKRMSRFKKVFYILRLLFISSLAVFGLVMWFKMVNQLG
ncbi:MAG: hypothetical protein IKJ63_11495 [Clostridia bacterium]|nr:hypothetical protein [Clostridia bacterium]